MDVKGSDGKWRMRTTGGPGTSYNVDITYYAARGADTIQFAKPTQYSTRTQPEYGSRAPLGTDIYLTHTHYATRRTQNQFISDKTTKKYIKHSAT